MKAFTNTTHTKESALRLAQLHYDADAFLAGTYGKGEYGTAEFKGCLVGCMANGNHKDFEELFGIPEHLAMLFERTFEGVTPERRKGLTLEILNAIPEGADLNDVWRQVAVERHKRSLVLLKDNEEHYAEQCRTAIQKVIDWLDAGADDESEEDSARSAAESAAWAAARSTRSAAWSARMAAESAALSAAWETEADVLIAVLKTQK